ncbi:hypothetical protein [Plantactinospora sp. B24E8]|uniref:hypothetical protein n=1 Tax=Plantactinospora sp. B24E8 TaxID=3153567 RepID=UPI00325C62A6
MRYLTRSFALGALWQGRAIGQFLGETQIAGTAAIRWVSVDPWGDRYRVSVHTAEDPDDENFGDLDNLPPLDPPDEDYVGQGRELALVADASEAIHQAARLTGARSDRWVNHGVAGEEYADLVRLRRGEGRARYLQ